MSYLNRTIYIIEPEGSYKIIRNCPKCNSKSKFVNTYNFRLNANGKKLDVWLIYQCEKCKHSYNLTLFERIKPGQIEECEYKALMNNDQERALRYGMNRGLLTKNRAVIDDENLDYKINSENAGDIFEQGQLEIHNPYGLRIRIDKVLAELLGISRSSIKKLVENNKIIIENRFVGTKSNVMFRDNDGSGFDNWV